MYLSTTLKIWQEFKLLFRVKNWWSNKVPPLLAIAYLFLLGQPDLIFYLLILFLWIIAFCCFGYFTNDWADISVDKKAGRQNEVAKLSITYKTIAISILTLLFLLPWFWLPTTPIILFLVLGQFLLFIFYSFKPIRLKNRGVLSLIADSLYAYVLPSLSIALSFGLVGVWPASQNIFLVMLVLWQIMTGLRNALGHQIKHRTEDIFVGAKTFASRIKLKNLKTYFNLLTAVEIGSLLAFLLVIKDMFPWLPFIYSIFIITRIFILKPPIEETAEGLVGNFHNEWLAPIILIFLTLNNWPFAIILFIHLVMFPFLLYGFKKRCLRMIKS